MTCIPPAIQAVTEVPLIGGLKTNVAALPPKLAPVFRSPSNAS